MRLVAIAFGVGAVLTGCGHVYDVRTEGNRGIPFFPLEAVDTTVAVHEQRWYELELTATRKIRARNQEPGVFTTTLVRFATSLGAARSVASGFALATSPAGAYDVAHGMMRDYQKNALLLAEPEPPSPDGITGLPLARLERRRDHVAAAVPLYINATVPFGGKNNAAIELSEKGTLSKVSAEVADELPGNVLAFLGTAAGSEAAKVAVSKAVGVAEAPQAATAEVLVSVSLRLTPVSRLYAITVVQGAGEARRCDVARMLRDPLAPGEVCRVGLSVETRRAGDKAGEDAGGEKPKKGDEISFSGAVRLPAPAGEDSKAGSKAGTAEPKR